MLNKGVKYSTRIISRDFSHPSLISGREFDFRERKLISRLCMLSACLALSV